MDEKTLPEVQRFRPYCVPGGQVAQVRLNPNGMYVRWADYQRVHMALGHLLMKCNMLAPAELNPAMLRARDALDRHVDWDAVFRGSSSAGHCNCYAIQGDSDTCPIHSGHSASTNEANK